MRLHKLLGAAFCLLALNSTTQAATLTGADLYTTATFPNSPPTLSGTSLIIGPPLSGPHVYPKMLSLPVSQYVSGNKLEITYNLTRLPGFGFAPDDSNPIFGVSDGNHMIVFAPGEDSNGSLGTGAMIDYGPYAEFLYGVTLADNYGFPAFGEPYSVTVSMEFSPSGVFTQGSAQGTGSSPVVSYQHNIPLDTAHLQFVLFHDNDWNERYQIDSLVLGGAEQAVAVDVKPGSCPNPISLAKQGVLPVAVNGTATLAATAIDPASIRLAGVAPLRHDLEDVATPYAPATGKAGYLACTTAGADGIADLTLKFDTQAVLNAIGPHSRGDVVTLPLTGKLYDGTAIVGEDVVWIRP